MNEMKIFQESKPTQGLPQAQRPTILYIVRHADVHNPQDVLYGRLPRYRLSELGRRQAEVTAQVLAEEPLSAIYTSPQLRARQTAAVIAKAHPDVPVRITRLLMEVLTGWQGRPHSELEEINFNFYDNPVNPGDERLEQLWARLNRFVGRVRRRYPGGAVVGVTHGDICFLARSGFAGLPIEIASIRRPHVYPDKGSITRLTFGADLKETYPISVEYYAPNDPDPEWSQGWVVMKKA